MNLTPYVKELWSIKFANDAIPPGGGFADGLRVLTTRGMFVEKSRAAAQWVQDAIKAVREAAEPNPWKTATDEEIATHIVEKIKARRSP